MTSTRAEPKRVKKDVIELRARKLVKNVGFQQWRSALVKSNAGARIKLVRAGVNASVLISASEYFAMPRAQFVKILGMSSATAERKIKSGSLLGQAESERLERLALIEDVAEKVLGTALLAREWLTRKNAALGESPITMLDTETGAGEVRKVLYSIAYGGVV
jgi:putative toxin-antitoxin system antitoxin component (TIGR02293 family)